MPELPEVETTLRGIQPHINDQIVSKINIYNPNLRWPVDSTLPSILKKQPLLNSLRRGKYLVLVFNKGALLLHLGMSGSLRVLDQGSELQKHDHFEIIFKNKKVLRLRDPRRFGSVLWTTDPWETHPLIQKMGPEPLSENFTDDHLFLNSRNKTVAVKSYIMNGHVVVGVGNIYASESLFLAGINPNKAASKISKQRYLTLTHAIKAILSNAIKQGGTTLKDFSSPDGKPGYFSQQLNVYGRKAEPCQNCGKPITQKVINQRATYYCTNCQK
ncbi:MAG: bifunctional DNA-formamidopyrimidine glycosylase/DNA-(apurinic or apyrimidinic site) lyase [Gammaproteobacteria bacterium]|nr:bifunctional DNA-formamidopyrimidine glycosylase/DNA-(apurinic or apyrimidinic site) lyase [Gammaproteobacteria bacterium]